MNYAKTEKLWRELSKLHLSIVRYVDSWSTWETSLQAFQKHVNVSWKTSRSDSFTLNSAQSIRKISSILRSDDGWKSGTIFPLWRKTSLVDRKRLIYGMVKSNFKRRVDDRKKRARELSNRLPKENEIFIYFKSNFKVLLMFYLVVFTL